MNRPAFAMQQCIQCIAFVADAGNYAYQRHFKAFNAYFTVVICPDPEIHMIVIGIFALECLLLAIRPAGHLRRPDVFRLRLP